MVTKMKKVKTITIVLAIILVTLIAFAGVYIQTQNRMENKIKDYNLGRELEGRRVIEIKVSTGDSTTDSEEKEKTQNPEVLTEENYEIVKKTIETRLKNLKAQDYMISLNKQDGTIRVELEENASTDMYAYFLTANSNVKIVEKDTKAELISDSMVKKAKYNYVTDKDGKYQTYLEVILTNDGQAKIEELSNEYAFLASEIEQIEAANKENTESKEENNNGNSQNNESENNTKKVTALNIGDSEYSIEKIEKNKLIIKIGNATTNATSANNSVAAASELALLINSGKYPVEYKINTNRYTYSDITKNQILYFALIVLVMIFVVLTICTVKYKTKGLLCAISFIGFIAVYSLLLRYTNTLITIEGMGAIILIIVINLILNQKVLYKVQKVDMVKEAVNNTYKEMFLKLIPVMIISVVFSFMRWSNINSFGIIMFWGLVLIAIYNIIVTKTLLQLKENK